jgi:hypothetical protein
MRNVSGKRCRENQNKHVISSKHFFSENRTFYERMWKNTAGQAYKILWCMRFVCWMPTATNTISANVILLRGSMLRYTYIAYLVEIVTG